MTVTTILDRAAERCRTVSALGLPQPFGEGFYEAVADLLASESDRVWKVAQTIRESVEGSGTVDAYDVDDVTDHRIREEFRAALRLAEIMKVEGA